MPIQVLHNCNISDAVLHESASVGPSVILDHTVMMQCSSAGAGARVTHCVLGPDAAVAGAECLHSIVGPFIGMHHTSLFIATLWPLGRGNVAYGAMVSVALNLDTSLCPPPHIVAHYECGSYKFILSNYVISHVRMCTHTVCAIALPRLGGSQSHGQNQRPRVSARRRSVLRTGRFDKVSLQHPAVPVLYRIFWLYMRPTEDCFPFQSGAAQRRRRGGVR